MRVDKVPGDSEAADEVPVLDYVLRIGATFIVTPGWRCHQVTLRETEGSFDHIVHLGTEALSVMEVCPNPNRACAYTLTHIGSSCLPSEN